MVFCGTEDNNMHNCNLIIFEYKIKNNVYARAKKFVNIILQRKNCIYILFYMKRKTSYSTYTLLY